LLALRLDGAGMSVKKLKRHTIVKIDGQTCQLTDTPREAIDGTWLVFYCVAVGSRIKRSYLTEQELGDLAATVTA
jgi:hypothetical protein